MQFGIPSQSEPSSPANTFSDQEMNERIKSKLFEKRKAILWNLKNREESNKVTYEEELRMNDLDLQALGYSKIDYEIYLAKDETLH